MAWEIYADFTSSNIASLRYDTDSYTLEVTFHGGGVYHYFDVPEHIWEAIKVAPSQGVYLNSQIKGHFRYSKV